MKCPRYLMVISLLTVGIGSTPLAVEAQPGAKLTQIGVLVGGPPRTRERLQLFEAFREGLRERGYVEGKNIGIEYRGAEKPGELQEVAASLVHQAVDIIVAGDPIAVQVAKQATTSIPIVMVISLDPIRRGYISSLARPGGNITGLTWDSEFEISGKYLEALKDAVFNLSHVAGLIDPGNPGIEPYRQAGEVAAKKLGLILRHVEWRAPGDLERAFDTIVQQRSQAVFVEGD